ncbi:E3 ubiquitin-protein ligase HOS1 [Platanthera zijinensis]|uniref:E3 ubiquitin-protein ligase HOS1 n=1 Tax=Platanthera zijinensis TaxID=2320716 RepID=A0AAP0BAB7_9ASPA
MVGEHATTDHIPDRSRPFWRGALLSRLDPRSPMPHSGDHTSEEVLVAWTGPPDSDMTWLPRVDFRRQFADYCLEDKTHFQDGGICECALKEKKQDALEHLASIDLLELCNEAKIERCRATRDLSSCGRNVEDVLNSCGHASLCAECSKRCDVCPICRTSLPVNGNRLRPRLYHECTNALLIPNRYADKFQEKDNNKDHILAIQRLYSLFDVALDNNLVSLICHYVTDVCMDESAVSSDPVLSFLLDEVVVKDWCKQRFKGIIHDLQKTYRVDLEEMKSKLCSLQKSASQLTGISNVLEVMVSSFKDNISAQLNDLHFLLNSTLKTKQTMDMGIWSDRLEYLQNNFLCWESLMICTKKSLIRKGKKSSPKRAEPAESGRIKTLWLYSAILNLKQRLNHIVISSPAILIISHGHRKSEPALFIEQALNDSSVCYPFKNSRAAVDVIFLHGASDMVVAKRAIFLYYLFDRHWTLPDAEWRFIIDDFASSFGINRLPLLESFVFYLLDDHTDNALQEACTLLPQIAGPDTHPKVAQVLLERKRSDVALTVLRCTGHDGFSGYNNSVDDEGKFVSLEEALTVLRVRTECGLLTEAFMCLRMYCHNLKESTAKPQDLLSSNSLKSDVKSHMEILVTELCLICIRIHLVDRMIELPWDSTEEIYIHKCLLEDAQQSPSICGSLLTVFYLQRYRYIEAFQVHQFKHLSFEQDYTFTYPSPSVACRLATMSSWLAHVSDSSSFMLDGIQVSSVKVGSAVPMVKPLGTESLVSGVQMKAEQGAVNVVVKARAGVEWWEVYVVVVARKGRSIRVFLLGLVHFLTKVRNWVPLLAQYAIDTDTGRVTHNLKCATKVGVSQHMGRRQSLLNFLECPSGRIGPLKLVLPKATREWRQDNVEALEKPPIEGDKSMEVAGLVAVRRYGPITNGFDLLGINRDANGCHDKS